MTTRGRKPQKFKGETRSQHMQVLLTPSESAALDFEAEELGLSKAALVRMKLKCRIQLSMADQSGRKSGKNKEFDSSESNNGNNYTAAVQNIDMAAPKISSLCDQKGLKSQEEAINGGSVQKTPSNGTSERRTPLGSAA